MVGGQQQKRANNKKRHLQMLTYPKGNCIDENIKQCRVGRGGCSPIRKRGKRRRNNIPLFIKETNKKGGLTCKEEKWKDPGRGPVKQRSKGAKQKNSELDRIQNQPLVTCSRQKEKLL